MNPALKDIVKEELQKLLDAGFIYPISDSEWVSPLVLVPKKNGKWRICVQPTLSLPELRMWSLALKEL